MNAAARNSDSQDATLPETTFRELAFELRLLINREVALNQGVEQYLARYPSESLALSYQDFLRSTERLAEAYRLLEALIPLEGAVRALVIPASRTRE